MVLAIVSMSRRHAVAVPMAMASVMVARVVEQVKFHSRIR